MSKKAEEMRRGSWSDGLAGMALENIADKQPDQDQH
jgi:hypothetical protein